MILMKGKVLADAIKKHCAEDANKFYLLHGRRPALAVVLSGNDPASKSYVAAKRKACDIAGIVHRDFFLSSEIKETELLELVDSLNADSMIDGILVQLPLPSHIDQNKVIERIRPDKDVDGFTPQNMGRLLLGQPCLAPCTAKGILSLLDYYDIGAESKNICIVGRSNIVGKPLAALLIQKDRNATVTICHSKSGDLRRYTLDADILITAVGKPGLIDGTFVKPNAAVIDVGITRIVDQSLKGYHWEGDADFPSVSKVAGALTPVPGGVGPMTVAMLMQNTIQAAFSRTQDL